MLRAFVTNVSHVFQPNHGCPFLWQVQYVAKHFMRLEPTHPPRAGVWGRRSTESMKRSHIVAAGPGAPLGLWSGCRLTWAMFFFYHLPAKNVEKPSVFCIRGWSADMLKACEKAGISVVLEVWVEKVSQILMFWKRFHQKLCRTRPFARRGWRKHRKYRCFLKRSETGRNTTFFIASCGPRPDPRPK